jgi:hypothetical protein
MSVWKKNPSCRPTWLPLAWNDCCLAGNKKLAVPCGDGQLFFTLQLPVAHWRRGSIFFNDVYLF